MIWQIRLASAYLLHILVASCAYSLHVEPNSRNHVSDVVACTFAGIVYGLYLTLSSWVLYYVATHMTFFHDNCHLVDLNTRDEVLVPYCTVSSPSHSTCSCGIETFVRKPICFHMQHSPSYSTSLIVAHSSSG